MFIKIATRNVFRNKRRTYFSVGIVALGVGMLVMLLGFVNTSLQNTKIALSQEIGALQVADTVLFDNRAEGFEYLIGPDILAQVVEILEADPRITGHAAQLNFGGIIGNKQGSTVLVASGVTPGNTVEDYSTVIVEGDPLSDDATAQILLGVALAGNLKVAPGDLINIATGTVSGAFKAASAKINGTVTFNNPLLDEQRGIVPLAYAQRLLRTDGVERVLVTVADIDEATQIAADIEAALQARGIPLETRTWDELNTFYESIEQFWGTFSAFTLIGVSVLAFFSMLEVLTMSFLERTREVGTIRAVGTKRFQVFWTFLLEGVWMGLMGGGLGLVLGAAIAFAINVSGLAWRPPGAIEDVPFQIQLNLTAMVMPFVTAMIATFLGTLYPAIRTARQNIVKSLSYV